MRHRFAIAIFVAMAASAVTSATDQAKPVFPNVAFDFGKVIRGTVVEHEFVLRNEGNLPLRLGNVRMSSALTLVRLPANVEPGATASLRFKLDTSRLTGLFEGLIVVSFADPSLPEARLSVEGTVVARLEATPPAFFVAVDRGKTQEQSIEIRNHDTEPIRIDGVDYSSERGAASIETLDEGRRYRLKLTVKGDGPAGKRTETIQLKTSSKTMPIYRIAANTYVRERVYTFPEAVDVGALPASAIRKQPDLLAKVAQTLMVYRKGTTDFQARFTTDIPGLSLTSARGAAGDRWQTTVMLTAESLKPGPIKGSIFIETNDPEFPRLTVPVSGHILDR